MKLLASFFLAGLLAAQTPKPPKGAEGFAAEMARLAGEYLMQLERKIDAEEAAYEQSARLFVEAHARTLFRTLEADRDTQAIDLTIALEEGRLTAGQLLGDAIPRYARKDFDHTRALFSQELDSQGALLRSLLELQVETKKAATLKKLLEDLAAKRDAAAWIAQLQASGQNFGAQMKRSDCVLSTSRLQTFEAEKKRLGEAIAKATGERKQGLLTQQASLEPDIQALTARRAATGLFDAAAKACKAQ